MKISRVFINAQNEVALGTATAGTGLTPLGVACLAGHVEVPWVSNSIAMIIYKGSLQGNRRSLEDY